MKKINVSSQFCEYTREISGKIKRDESSVECQIPDAALNMYNIGNGFDVKAPELNFGSCPEHRIRS